MPDRLGLIELTQKLQEQSDVPGWVLASSSTVLAVAAGKAEEYGPRGKWFFRLFSLLGVTVYSQLALQLIGSIVVTLWWIKGRRATSVPPSAVLFIGFGAGPERQMLEKFREEVGCQVVHLDQTKPESLSSVTLPKLLRLWKGCAVEARKVIRSLRTSQYSFVRGHAEQWLISSTIRFSSYVFVKVWAKDLPLSVNYLVFISADIPAFAALDAENSELRHIEYRQHGLHKISIIFPPFKKLCAINRQEALHMMKRLPLADVSLVSKEKILPVRDYKETVLFVSPYECALFSKYDYKDAIQAVHQWTAEEKMQLVVRPHPSEGAGFWQGQFPDIPIDDSTGGFNGALTQFKPYLVIGWYSTALLDALKAGHLPVLIMAGSETALEDMVFPLAEIALNWPRDLALIQSLIDDPTVYRKEVAARQFAAFGVAA